MEVDMKYGKLLKLPCRNDEEIDEEVRAWEKQFDADNVEPILKFMGDLHQLNRILGVTVDMPRKPATYPCSVKVLSVDHNSKGDGMYFNFAKEQLDAILGTTNWS